MLRLNYLVLVFVFALNQVCSDVPQKIFVTVYYESQCPDSKEFITNQLQPTINLLHKYLMLRLVPFGKARSINKGYNGFECQHGPTECAGNLVQSCALDLMQGRNDVEKVSYVACEMQTEAGTRGDMECVMRASVPVDQVKACVTSEKGIMLQLEDEYLTNLVKPKFIPTIIIGEVFNQQVQDSALEDFTGTLCSIFTNIPPCQEHYNSMAMRYVLL
ncbi:hypothetical protein PYW07_012199 [Mythimna separata]|uniref:Gamma-interferon-inducible lysosomal thiol reductase n=1 Tax=Mythimna separata TaxID=271217 RepID=A0AAD7YKR9_MYTSE|nr:hypothetical protein PYW07_012199 [Mythimna separata]